MESEDRSCGDAEQVRSRERLLWLFIASLFCSLALWMYWSVIAVLMLQMGSPHLPAELFSLIAIAGLSGGSLRITIGFLMPAQRGVVFFTLGITLLLVPALACGLLVKVDTPLWVLQLLALISGIGAGSSSAFIGAINGLLPNNARLTALRLGVGLGHLGVAGAQILLPLAITFGLWGLAGKGLTAESTLSTWLGRLPPDTKLWLPSTGYIWLLPLCIIIFFMWLARPALYSLPRENFSFPSSLGRMLVALSVGFSVSALGVWLSSPAGVAGANLQLSHELIVGLVIFLTLMLLNVLPGSLGRSVDQPYAIFNNKHTWLMGAFSAASLGSFLGFAAALPLTFHLVFGLSHLSSDVHVVNVNAPGIFGYVWLGPFVGVLMHPVGGWMVGRLGGARTTQLCLFILMFTSAIVAYYLFQAYHSREPEQYFLPTLLLLLLLFAAAGAGYSSVMRTAEHLFPPVQAVYINIWLAAIAAYGVFYVPTMLAEKLEQNAPEQAMIGFAVFYGVCLLLNHWFYLRRDSAFFNP